MAIEIGIGIGIGIGMELGLNRKTILAERLWNIVNKYLVQC